MLPSHRSLIRLALAASALVPLPAAAQDGRPREAHLEFLLGTAWSLPSTLEIRLPGREPIRHRARWGTRPLRDSPYYAYRFGGGTLAPDGVGPVGFEGELLHHKLYLENPAPPIEHFEVTHGYNLALLNAVRPAERMTARVSIGLTVAHAEGMVAGRRVGGVRRTLLGRGYHVAGLSAQLALGQRWPLGRGRTALYAAPEARLTVSRARVPIGDDGGWASVPNAAVHLLGGVGVRRVWR